MDIIRFFLGTFSGGLWTLLLATGLYGLHAADPLYFIVVLTGCMVHHARLENPTVVILKDLEDDIE